MNGTKVQERIVLPNFLRLKRRNPPLKRRKLQTKKYKRRLDCSKRRFIIHLKGR